MWQLNMTECEESMSTRCYIAKQAGEGKYRTIYCHSDGYPEGVGKILLTYYGYPEKIDQLLDLGDISVLDKWIYPDPEKPHGFGYSEVNGKFVANSQEGVTLAYGRDRGDTETRAQVYTLKELDAGCVAYVYIYSNGVWKYFKRLADGMQFLKEDSKEEAEEEELIPMF